MTYLIFAALLLAPDARAQGGCEAQMRRSVDHRAAKKGTKPAYVNTLGEKPTEDFQAVTNLQWSPQYGVWVLQGPLARPATDEDLAKARAAYCEARGRPTGGDPEAEKVLADVRQYNMEALPFDKTTMGAVRTIADGRVPFEDRVKVLAAYRRRVDQNFNQRGGGPLNATERQAVGWIYGYGPAELDELDKKQPPKPVETSKPTSTTTGSRFGKITAIDIGDDAAPAVPQAGANPAPAARQLNDCERCAQDRLGEGCYGIRLRCAAGGD